MGRADRQELRTLREHTGNVNAATFSPDGGRVVTASSDGTAMVWDAQTGRNLLTFKGHGGIVTSAVFSPDGKQIVTASWDGKAKVWDAQTGNVALTLQGHTDLLNSASSHPTAEDRDWQRRRHGEGLGRTDRPAHSYPGWTYRPNPVICLFAGWAMGRHWLPGSNRDSLGRAHWIPSRYVAGTADGILAVSSRLTADVS